jgi:hypothetical protein
MAIISTRDGEPFSRGGCSGLGCFGRTWSRSEMRSAATCLQWPLIFGKAGHEHSEVKPLGVTWSFTAYGSGSVPRTCPVADRSSIWTSETACRRT